MSLVSTAACLLLFSAVAGNPNFSDQVRKDAATAHASIEDSLETSQQIDEVLAGLAEIKAIPETRRNEMVLSYTARCLREYWPKTGSFPNIVTSTPYSDTSLVWATTVAGIACLALLVILGAYVLRKVRASRIAKLNARELNRPRNPIGF